MLLTARVDLYFIGSIHVFIYQLLVFVAVVRRRNTLIIFLTIFEVTWFHSTSSGFGVDHLIVFETNRIIFPHVVDSSRRHLFLFRCSNTRPSTKHWYYCINCISSTMCMLTLESSAYRQWDEVFLFLRTVPNR